MPGLAMNARVNRFSGTRLTPLYPKSCRVLNVNFGPNLVVPQGTVLGKVTAAANDVQTITITGTPTGGSLTLTTTVNGVVATSTPIPYNANAAAVQTALAALVGSANVAVSGGPFPGSAAVVTFQGSLANQPIAPITASIAALTGGTPAIGIVHTTVGVTANTHVPYASGNSDGSQVAVCISEYDVATDAAGNVYFGLQAGSEWGQVYPAAPAYFNGDFACADLVGLDANALTNLNAHLISGTVTAGVVHIP